MGLLDMFGFTDIGDMAPMPETAEKKASAKTKEATETSKKSPKKETKTAKQEDFTVVLPVTIKSRGFCIEMEGTGELKISTVFKKLYEMGYEEVSIPGINAEYDSAANTVYITAAILPDPARTAVSFGEEGSVIIQDGMTKCEVSANDFQKAPDEISVLDISDYWTSVNHIYKGCSMFIAGKYAYPCFDRQLSDTEPVALPCEIFVNGSLSLLTENDFLQETITVKDIVEKYMGADTNTNVRGVICSNLDRTCYFLLYKQKKTVTTPRGTITAKKGAQKNVVEKYALPLTVFLSFIGKDYELTPADFDGKERITLKEIRTYFSSRFRIFADDSRKLDSIYIEEENYLSLMFISGKKGALYPGARDCPALDTEFPIFQKKRAVFSAIERDDFPIGVFFLSKSASGEIESARFHFSLPKIPKRILNDVVSYFRKDIDNEAYVKICYNQLLREYFIVQAESLVSKAEVIYFLPAEAWMNNRNIVQVMDIHSHNTMPAYFSDIDNADECYPGLFGVIGNLASECPSMRFRAGYEGVFTPLSIDKLFQEDLE